ncbi:ATP-dependent zinc metalloprotease FtsH [Ruminococcus sp.]|uniref:ATP-dependent zinc metalloprotease FtsH n=1 Tax=Ruminococcus sp. TaxID=41978 RepID=UPI002B780272|nr:ATP-dependent zinc metalloprotease FtsH [Ruminococcus sp.]HNZ98559.1 ATP-dependent zinc metalloprotease FtsH [Ruminococcus sp.]HOH86914.1 ATP-dependent zinc metalloprotease FtsH [Ruminococcus sp.]
MNEEKNPRKQYAVYIVICLVLLMVFNAIVMPKLTQAAIRDADYSFFLDSLDEGNVKKVQIEDSEITFTVEEEGKEQAYSTVRIDDPDLVTRLHESGDVEFTGKLRERSPLRDFLLGWIIPIVCMFMLWNLLFKGLGKRMGGLGNAMSFGKSNAKIYVKAQTGKTFADVAGQDEAKEALAEIVDFLHNPDKYAEIGADLPKGALLVGPPGTGKTLLAQAVAGEAEVPFFSISGSEFVEMFVGMGAAKVRDLFSQATQKAPCIVFIDEIDTIGKKRDGQVGGNDEREQTLNQLLTEMDGFDGKKGVVILAATNRPESLDPALLRPGRFDRRIPVELPDLAGREAVLKVHAKKVKLAEKIDFNAIARATAGASGAELANIVNEAALRAVRSGRSAVNQSDLEESVEVVIAGYQRKNAVISQKEKEMIAYHEVGHALVAAMQKDSAPVHKITIIPRTSGALGYTMQVDEDEKFLMSKEEALCKIATLTGGRSAEELIFNTCTTGASNDIEKATKLARAMVTRYGMSSKFDMMALETVNNQYLGGDSSLICSPETAAKIDEEVGSIVRNAHTKAVQILTENIGKLHEIARFLLEKETITGEEFMAILRREPQLTA